MFDTWTMIWGKLNERKTGRFKISWAGKQACILEGILAGYYHTLHISLLETYRRETNALSSIMLPLFKNNQSYYILEKIITYSKENNKTLFLIVGKEYTLHKVTWELYK